MNDSTWSRVEAHETRFAVVVPCVPPSVGAIRMLPGLARHSTPPCVEGFAATGAVPAHPRSSGWNVACDPLGDPVDYFGVEALCSTVSVVLGCGCLYRFHDIMLPLCVVVLDELPPRRETEGFPPRQFRQLFAVCSDPAKILLNLLPSFR